jgi:indolepyruvate ferredoxin oxidoreductase
VGDREQAVVSGSTALTEAVAKYLYKLMAYKDEYEVARLYSDGDFQRKLADTFEGDYRLTFHLAPPIMNSGLDALGRPKKSSFGPWMLKAFKLLARFKVLRGTALDPFGRFAERREERALIDDYRALVEELLVGLKPDNHTIAVACASLPDQVRGYGPVKAESMRQYYDLRAAQLHRFHNPASVVRIQEVA